MKSPRDSLLSLVYATRPLTQKAKQRPHIAARDVVIYLLIFGLAAGAIGTFLRWHISTHYRKEMASWQARQTSLADDQAGRVADWLKERQGDVQVLSVNPDIRAVLLAQSTQGHAPAPASADLLETSGILNDMARGYSYAGVYVLDRNTKVVTQSSGSESLSPFLADSCADVLRSGAARFALVGDAPSRSLMAFMAPVFAGPNVSAAARPPGKLLGMVLVVSDASKTLFPLVTREVVPSGTGETILVRREGNDVVYFSPLRLVPTLTRQLRFPISSAPLPARLALDGQVTFGTFTDYRGVTVLGTTQTIPLTGWGLVRKIDRAEALEDFERAASAELLAGAFLIILLGSFILFYRRDLMIRSLQQDEKKFKALLESPPDVMVVVDSAGHIVFANSATERMFGYKLEELLGKSYQMLVPQRFQEEIAAFYERILANPELHQQMLQREVLCLRRDGSEFPAEISSNPVETLHGAVVAVAIRDITQRKRAEQELRRVNRALRTISDCKKVVMGAARELDLLKDICTLLVDAGGYRMAWVGVAEQDEDKTVRPVAFAGHEEGYLQSANVTWADVERGRGPIGTSIRTEMPVVVRDYLADASFAPWREAALKRGYASTISLPILLNGKAFGALSIYATDVDCFDSEEVRLLTELSHDLAFGIEALRTRIERQQAEEALQNEKAFTESIIDSLPEAFFVLDSTGRMVRWNKKIGRNLGYSAEEFAAMGPMGRIPKDEQASAATKMLEALTVGNALSEVNFLTSDGIKIPYLLTATRAVIAGKTYLVGMGVDISERKRAEKALQQGEEKYRTLLSNIPDVAWTIDAGLHFVFITNNIEKMSGFSVEDIERLGIDLYLNSIHPDDLRKVKDGLTALFAEGCPYDVECRVKRKSGEWIWVHDRAVGTYEKGGIRYADGLLSDITDRKKAEEAVVKSEERYRALYEDAPVGLYQTTPDGRILAGNPAFVRMLGYSSFQELAKRDLNTSGFEPNYPRSQFIDLMEKQSEVTGMESVWHKRNGELLHVRENARAIRDESGKIVYYEGTAEDVTERMRAEEEHIRLVTAIEQSAEAVVITNTQGEIEYVNPAFTRITGYSREEALGKNPRILKADKQDPEFYQQLWSTIVKGQPWHGELVNQRKDGSLYTEQMNITPVLSAHGEVTHFIATKQDVTERKNLEAQLQQSAKIEAVGRLAGGVAHDFNNLLTIINGYSELLLDELASDQTLSGYLKEIHNAGERAASLTRQLLAFSRRQVLAPQVLDLNMVVSNLESMLRRLIGEDIVLRTALAPQLGRVTADPGQIEQVIMNLAVNARDAMPYGGNLMIETCNAELDETFARNHVTVKTGPHVMLAVSDNGLGMTPETKAHIFEPFFTTKEKGKGTGLGLATVYGIVKQSEGSIWVYSELGHGTVFKVYLPAVTGHLEAAELARAEPASELGTETILVVEDEAGVRSLIRLELESFGYKVLDMDGGEKALATCASHEGPIHLLLTDVVMPQMSGPVVAEKVAALRPGIKVLYMSGYTDDAIVHLGVLSQGMPFIQKPFSPVALRKKIREVLSGK